MSFYLPVTNSKNKHIFKSFNSKYFKIIKYNISFIDELNTTIKKIFSDECIIKKINKKIYSLLENWQTKLINKEILNSDLVNDIKTNSKLKLPWTFTEILFAKNITIKQLK